ncbi:MAG: hypothetical protein IJ743_04705 [Bacilli bacterium]|nr:hypothetical protein [Bacilli bacterium]
MHTLKDLLNMNYLIYEQIVNKSGLPVESVNQLLLLERHLFEHMTSEEVSSLINEFQKMSADFSFDEGINAILTRISNQLAYMKHFYEMQESTCFTIRKLRRYEMNEYVNRIFADVTFYEHFHRRIHKHLENNSQNDFIYSFFYPNYQQTQQKLVPPISEEEFWHHEECDHLLLEDFQNCCERVMQYNLSTSLVEGYLKTFPTSLAPFFDKRLLQYKKLQDLFKKYRFDMMQERERGLAIYQKTFEFDFSEFMQYQEWMNEIGKASEEVLYSIKNAFYQFQHGTKEDVDEAYQSLLEDMQNENKVLKSCFSTVDELQRFRGYLVTTQLDGCCLSFPLLLSFFESENELSQNFMSVVFANRILNQLDEIEKDLMKEEYNDDSEDDALQDYIYQIQESQQVFLEFFKGEISLETFVQDILDIKKEFEIVPHYMVERNMVSSLIQILSKDYLEKEKREKLTSICCYAIFMQAIEDDALLDDFESLPFYSYCDSKEFSSSFREEYEEMSKSNTCYGVYPYLKKAYKEALYHLLSEKDRELLKQHLKLARNKKI